MTTNEQRAAEALAAQAASSQEFESDEERGLWIDGYTLGWLSAVAFFDPAGKGKVARGVAASFEAVP